MFIIHANDNFRLEREYIFDVVFRDFWEIDYEVKYEPRTDILIEYNNDTKLHLADTFLQMDSELWLQQASLPTQPLHRLTVPDIYRESITEEILPIIYGDTEKDELFSSDDSMCHLDIFGSALFMLTRYEEAVKQERDKYDRFPAYASLAYQEGFLERPIINEYLEILWQWLIRHIPGLKRKKRHFSIMPTHDVDNPFWSMSVDWPHRIRVLAGDVLKRRNLGKLRTHIGYIAAAARKDYTADPHNTFDTIMDISEELGLTSHFYFMTARNRNGMDGDYDIMHSEIRKLARSMVERGHKIGIHGGFGSYKNSGFIKDDVAKLRQMITTEKLSVEHFGGRQHYLHWAAPDTWAYYEQADIAYDTTLSYADHIGFRCGICYDYPVYNVKTHEQYHLREYPLEVMEGSGLAAQYMNLTHAEMLSRCLALKSKTEKYQGTFVILWHNTSFITQEYTELYREILEQ